MPAGETGCVAETAEAAFFRRSSSAPALDVGDPVSTRGGFWKCLIAFARPQVVTCCEAARQVEIQGRSYLMNPPNSGAEVQNQGSDTRDPLKNRDRFCRIIADRSDTYLLIDKPGVTANSQN